MLLTAAAGDGTNNIFTVAGDGTNGFSGDDGPATQAQLSFPTDVAVTADGGYLIADYQNDRIREVDASGTITTVAGGGTSNADGVLATDAELSLPQSVALTADGGYLIAEAEGNLVRKVSAGGTITTVAGTGTAGSSGDGGPATGAQISPDSGGLAATPDGGFLIADNSNLRLREVDADGIIDTIAGNGDVPDTGDGGPAVAAQTSVPIGVAVAADGSYLVSELIGGTVRRISPAPEAQITTVVGTGTGGSPATAGWPRWPS